MTTIHVTLPTPNGRDLTEKESEAIVGQWITVLAFGQSYMAQVTYATPLPWTDTHLELTAEIGAPEVEQPEDIAPVFHGSPVHINCPHDVDAEHSASMICSGPLT